MFSFTSQLLFRPYSVPSNGLTISGSELCVEVHLTPLARFGISLWCLVFRKCITVRSSPVYLPSISFVTPVSYYANLLKTGKANLDSGEA